MNKAEFDKVKQRVNGIFSEFESLLGYKTDRQLIEFLDVDEDKFKRRKYCNTCMKDEEIDMFTEIILKKVDCSKHDRIKVLNRDAKECYSIIRGMRANDRKKRREEKKKNEKDLSLIPEDSVNIKRNPSTVEECTDTEDSIEFKKFSVSDNAVLCFCVSLVTALLFAYYHFWGDGYLFTSFFANIFGYFSLFSLFGGLHIFKKIEDKKEIWKSVLSSRVAALGFVICGLILMILSRYFVNVFLAIMALVILIIAACFVFRFYPLRKVNC